MVSAIAHELELQQNFIEPEPFHTIYFGGGTPSILPSPELDRLLNVISKKYNVAPDPEITLEANPDDLSKAKLADLKSLGINRLSIGIQSFQNHILKFINRAHSAEEAIQAYENARSAGFGNISIDLIFSFPGSTNELLTADINTALTLAPEHISVYHLTVEEKTVFGNWQRKGKISQLHEDDSAEQFEILINTLISANYEQYEISNFCRDGHYSKHNSGYWKNAPYLGVGPGAHSYNGFLRQFNVSHNQQYMNALEKGIVPGEVDSSDKKSLANDFMLASLRTKWGCDTSLLRKSFDVDILEIRRGKIEANIKNGLMLQSGNNLILTPKGLFIADTIIGDLMVD
jgi:oxygen-independent coproporphyrinogen III oxidase